MGFYFELVSFGQGVGFWSIYILVGIKGYFYRKGSDCEWVVIFKGICNNCLYWFFQKGNERLYFT